MRSDILTLTNYNAKTMPSTLVFKSLFCWVKVSY